MSIEPGRLIALEPQQLLTWLRSRGWSPLTIQDGVYATFSYTREGQEPFLVDVPLNRQLRDYARRVWQVLEIAATWSQVPPERVLGQMETSQVDVVRLRLDGRGIEDGRLPIELGAHLFVSARELMVAAACAAHQPRSVYRTRKPDVVTHFMRNIKLAAPERGSFVVTVHSPLPPLFQPPLPGLAEEAPFERRATQMLCTSVELARVVSDRAIVTGDLQPVLDGVPGGLSANLCDALTGLVDGEVATSLVVEVGWASGLPVPRAVPPRSVLDHRHVRLLAEASKALRARSPDQDFQLEGVVVKLHSEQRERGGSVMVTSRVDERSCKILVLLGPEDYRLAIRAHEGGHLLRCEGELRRDGRHYELRSARHVEMVEVEE